MAIVGSANTLKPKEKKQPNGMKEGPRQTTLLGLLPKKTKGQQGDEDVSTESQMTSVATVPAGFDSDPSADSLEETQMAVSGCGHLVVVFSLISIRRWMKRRRRSSSRRYRPSSVQHFIISLSYCALAILPCFSLRVSRRRPWYDLSTRTSTTQ